jgi:hypothetical protein
MQTSQPPLFTLKRLNELPILERLQLRDLFISNLLAEDQDLKFSQEEEEILPEPKFDPVRQEMFWQIIEWTQDDEKALIMFPWLTKQSLTKLRAKIAEARAKEDEEW